MSFVRVQQNAPEEGMFEYEGGLHLARCPASIVTVQRICYNVDYLIVFQKRKKDLCKHTFY